jgi:hypothetical protein
MIGKKSRRNAQAPALGGALLPAFQGALEGLRFDVGLSRQAFAKWLGIPRSSYFHLMTAAANPTLGYIESIAERAGVDPITFLERIAATDGHAVRRRNACER